MRVVKTGDDAATLHVDHLCGRTAQCHGLRVVTNDHETAVLDRHRAGQRLSAVYGMKLAIEQNQIGAHRSSFDKK